MDLPREDRSADWHFTTQTRLFEFFVALHSAFESSFYGLYFAGSRLAGQSFALAAAPVTYYRIKANATASAFEAAWPNSPFAAAMSALFAGDVYKDLAEVRNVLAHRIAPGFEHRLTLGATEEEYELDWRGQALATLIPTTLHTAEEALASLWQAAADFFAPQPA
ncbi:hypothetical protein ACGFWD_44800 [Streptomyces sp. NPDC048448]|uniref:hypothetical protein n=1 Tax=unclassified Streptomyces TaxID=2593676 RepID=UPI003445EEEF